MIVMAVFTHAETTTERTHVLCGWTGGFIPRSLLRREMRRKYRTRQLSGTARIRLTEPMDSQHGSNAFACRRCRNNASHSSAGPMFETMPLKSKFASGKQCCGFADTQYLANVDNSLDLRFAGVSILARSRSYMMRSDIERCQY